jgi:hypothetical protein
MKTLTIWISIFAVALCVCGADTTARMKLKVAKDGFPSGHNTPEGAACDLARAFIKHDAALFSSARVRRYGPQEYETFLADTVAQMKAAKKAGVTDGPQAIGKVFAARHLKQKGAAAFGQTSYGFQDVMFVDVGVMLKNGSHSLFRTLVIKDKDGKWYANPMPGASPRLSAGLNEEAPSKTDFSEVYEVQR